MKYSDFYHQLNEETNISQKIDDIEQITYQENLKKYKEKKNKNQYDFIIPPCVEPLTKYYYTGDSKVKVFFNNESHINVYKIFINNINLYSFINHKNEILGSCLFFKNDEDKSFSIGYNMPIQNDKERIKYLSNIVNGKYYNVEDVSLFLNLTKSILLKEYFSLENCSLEYIL